MQAKKKKIIQVSPENRKKLIALHGCTQATVYNALAYKTDSELAVAIRKDALERFGGIKNDRVIFL